ncbi:MAG: hypothetical protein LBK47_02605 [Prevotellaceae bacterium]|jgi:hypothetical protein|nr:hypothetical protein [Prevotellaceae bacterium]
MSWDSPYQTPLFHEVLNNTGFRSVLYRTQKGVIYANNWIGNHLTAWEIPKDHYLNRSWRLCGLVFEEVVPYGKINIDDASFYYTPIIKLDEAYRDDYSSVCRRNIAKAMLCNLTFENIKYVDFIKHPRQLIQLILSAPMNCNGYSNDTFLKLVAEILNKGCGDLFVVRNEAGIIIAVCVLIVSDTTSNLRFSAIDRQYSSMRPMNYMIDQLTLYYTRQGKKILDLSGFATTNVTQDLQNINRFKKAFTSQYAAFKIINT